MTFATIRLNSNIYCKNMGQMSEWRGPIGPIDIVVIGLMEHENRETQLQESG